MSPLTIKDDLVALITAGSKTGKDLEAAGIRPSKSGSIVNCTAKQISAALAELETAGKIEFVTEKWQLKA